MRNKMKMKHIKGPKFTDEDIWDLCDTFAKFIYKGLVQFKNSPRCGLTRGLSEQEWENILDKMIFSFRELSMNFPNDPHNLVKNEWTKNNELKISFKNNQIETNYNPCYPENIKELEKEYYYKIKEGKYLFAEYFESLWD